MPKFGQMTEESAIVEWLKKEGDKVDKGDILFTVETDKSVMEVESFEAGTLIKIVVPPKVNVPVQSTVGFLGNPGEPIPTVTAPAPAAPKKAEAGTPASSTARCKSGLAVPEAGAPLPSAVSFGTNRSSRRFCSRTGWRPSRICRTPSSPTMGRQ